MWVKNTKNFNINFFKNVDQPSRQILLLILIGDPVRRWEKLIWRKKNFPLRINFTFLPVNLFSLRWRSRNLPFEILKILSKHYKLLKTSFSSQFKFAEFEFDVNFSILHFPDLLYSNKLELCIKSLSPICWYKFF